MITVLTPDEMAGVDADATEPVEVLIHRAGGAVARAAVRMLGGSYGRRVLVVAGPGNNGNDGRDAADRLRRRGIDVRVIDAGQPWPEGTYDLVIDAAFGTGLARPYVSPIPAGQRVLAVDIASGLDGLSGAPLGVPPVAEETITFAALKPGHLLGSGPSLSGTVNVVDIGLDVSRGRVGLVEDSDVANWYVGRTPDAHKWNAAVWIVGGSADMHGAPALASSAAFAAGAGYVRLSSPGSAPGPGAPIEAVNWPVPLVGWADDVRSASDRCAAVLVGPGLGRGSSVRNDVLAVANEVRLPMVIDGDGLWAIAESSGPMSGAVRVLTPHDGEFEQLSGRPPGDDRISAARGLAAERSAVVVLKGPTTVVAEPSGRVRLICSGDRRLATAGTGDVLAGVIVAMLALGMDAFDAAATACHVHGRAASGLMPTGMTASQLPAQVSEVLSRMVPSTPPPTVRTSARWD